MPPASDGRGWSPGFGFAGGIARAQGQSHFGNFLDPRVAQDAGDPRESPCNSAVNVFGHPEIGWNASRQTRRSNQAAVFLRVAAGQSRLKGSLSRSAETIILNGVKNLESWLQANIRARNRTLGEGLQALRQVQADIDLLIEWPAKLRRDCPAGGSSPTGAPRLLCYHISDYSSIAEVPLCPFSPGCGAATPLR